MLLTYILLRLIINYYLFIFPSVISIVIIDFNDLTICVPI